jgi:hypothetical protein
VLAMSQLGHEEPIGSPLVTAASPQLPDASRKAEDGRVWIAPSKGKNAFAIIKAGINPRAQRIRYQKPAGRGKSCWTA